MIITSSKTCTKIKRNKPYYWNFIYRQVDIFHCFAALNHQGRCLNRDRLMINNEKNHIFVADSYRNRGE